MKEKIGMKRHVIGYILLIAALILAIQNIEIVLAVVDNLLGVIQPLTLGAVMAYILNILMKRLERLYFPKSQNKILKKTKRGVCIVLSMLLIVAILGLVIGLVVPELAGAIAVIAEAVPVFFEKLTAWLMTYSDQFPVIEEYINGLEIDWQQLAKNVMSYVTSGVGGIFNSAISVVGVVAGSVVNFVIALIVAIYVLSSKEKLGEQVKRLLTAYLPEQKKDRILEIVKVADTTFSSFIVGQCTEAVILGSLCTIGMWILQFPYAPMTGAFIGVTALIPVAGAYIGAGVGAFMILTVDPMKAVLFLLFIVCLQQLEGNLIYPRVVGSSVGLPALWVLAAVTVGGGISGVLGMLLGVPLAATLYKLLGDDVNKRIAKRKKSAVGMTCTEPEAVSTQGDKKVLEEIAEEQEKETE
ncbi:MAG: AI-2E family transporter [Lachnospiraceae bacterium]|nr:AI-2E family transporter [Lachnospiraceae bacterium]